MESFLSNRSGPGAEPALARAAEPSGGFQALFSTPRATPSATGEACDGQGEPQLEIVNGPSGVERIIIVCTCGKRIEVKCEYE